MRRTEREKPIVGWLEWISLPELEIGQMKAKVDTGARTSALHAYKAKPFRHKGKRFVRFYVHPVQRRRHPEILCEAPIVDERIVTSSNGEQEHRYVIETSLRIGDLEWPIEVTLTNRDNMGFRMLLGRRALAGRFLVDPGASYKIGGSKRGTRKQLKELDQ